MPHPDIRQALPRPWPCRLRQGGYLGSKPLPDSDLILLLGQSGSVLELIASSDEARVINLGAAVASVGSLARLGK